MMKQLHLLSLFLLMGILTGVSQESSGLPDVWDFGATQLDDSQYDNQLSVEVINSWYDASVTAGSSGNTLPDFTAGDLSFTGGGSDRLRTSNTALTRYDENIDDYEDFKGRVYINSSGATGRFFSIALKANDKVTIWALTQNGTGNIHFEYAADASVQNDVVAVGEELTELSFVAQAAGTYRIYDDTDKPSYFRIMRESDAGSTETDTGEDVWDFGATQLDESQYNNKLSVEVINSFYDASITPGSSGNTMPDFTAGDLSFTGGGSDRLRTSNTALTRYDENIDEYEDFKGRVYINSSGATDRFFSLELKEDDEVTLWTLTQNGTGNIHFEYVADPSLQNDVVAVGGELTELNFVAKAEGTYKIYDDTDKPSYFRIVRKAATYSSISGNVDVAAADGIPTDFQIVFTNEAGKTWSASVSEGAYNVDLPAGYQYDVSLAGADGFNISGDTTLEVSESTSSFDIAIQEEGSGGNGLIDVWDFGATQLDASQYNNKLSVDVINSWYDASVTPGSSGNTLPDFTVGDLSFTGGGSDRLRTSNTALTRYDENIDEYEDFKGRVYINSSGATGRFFSIDLEENDKVSIWALTQNGTGNIHFEYVADPSIQNDVVAVGGEITELNFVAQTAGTYRIYDDTDKPSYFRITREPDTGVVEPVDGDDVWDFGATQLDASQYNNQLSEGDINSWYDPSITPGSSGNTLPDFTAGDLSFTGGGNDRLRTSNTNLTRYDENINDYEDFKGRIYINSSGAEGRFFSLELEEDDKVTLWALTQNGTGNIHFEYVDDPDLQDNVVPVGGDITELSFVAKAAGTYRIYDDTDKPSYFRIIRSSATYANLSGNIDITEAPGIPDDYSIVFSIEEGKTWNVQPSGGSYEVELPIGFEYSISLEGADEYVISNGTSLSLTEGTTSRDITIEKVELYTVTGSITGLGDKIADIDLAFTSNATGAVYVPEAVVDNEAGTYTVRLEPNINYIISGGVDGYYIPDNQLEITGETTREIVFEPVPDGPFGDLDEDGILNSEDNCVYTPNQDQADSDENGIGDVCEDDDGDGVINFDDNCPDTPEGAVVDVFGCEVFDLAANNYSIIANEVSCNGLGDGFIGISAADVNYTYNVVVSGPSESSASLSESNGFSTDIDGLAAGTYNVCITIDGRQDYEQCFRVTIEGPTPLAAYSSVDYGNNTVAFSLSGGNQYTIEHNGRITTTTQSNIVLDLEKGRNKINIKGDSECQGTIYKEVLLSEEVVVFPNPTQGDLKVYINGEDRQIDVSLHGFNGQSYISKEMEVPEDRVLRLDLTNYRNGIYFLTLKSATVSKSIKVIKS